MSRHELNVHLHKCTPLPNHIILYSQTNDDGDGDGDDDHPESNKIFIVFYFSL